MRPKYFQYGLWILAILLVGIQFIRPARTNPPVDPAHTVEALTSIPPEVRATLHRACFDCHSNESRWPWYSNVAPVSWLLANHVGDARRKVNFSEWDKVMGPRAARRLDNICGEVREGGMPLPSYLWIHHDARLSPSEVQSICAWTESEQKKPPQTAR